MPADSTMTEASGPPKPPKPKPSYAAAASEAHSDGGESDKGFDLFD